MKSEKEDQQQFNMLTALTESSLIRFKIVALDKFPGIDKEACAALKEEIIKLLEGEEDMVEFMVC
jgi:hypothetical protein